MNNMNNNIPTNYELVLGFLQVFNVILNMNQVSNDEIMKELQLQDNNYFTKLLDDTNIIINQNKTIIEQNKEILRRFQNEKDKKDVN